MNPASRSADSFAGETDSGLASVVTSAPSANPKRSSIRRRIRISSAADSSDGVPPPKNTVSTRGTAAPSTPRRQVDLGDHGVDVPAGLLGARAPRARTC